MSDKLIGKERALILAQMATEINGQEFHKGWTIKDSVGLAEEILIASEELVAKKYGEFR
jgi:hypothetical protein